MSRGSCGSRRSSRTQGRSLSTPTTAPHIRSLTLLMSSSRISKKFAAIQHLKGVGPKTLAALADPEVLRKHYKAKTFIKWISKQKPSVAEIRESPLLKLNLNYLPPDVLDASTTYLEKVLQRKETCPTYTELLADAITVRTIHSAKGLEFPVVVVDLIGFTPWEDTPEEIEDECRVLYVAMSRAKDQLYLLGRNNQMFPNLEALMTFLKAQTQ